MKNIAIYGAGGFGKEVKGMLDMQKEHFTFAGFIDDYKVLDEKIKKYDDVLLAIADPRIRKDIVEKQTLLNAPFNAIISQDVLLHPSVRIGKGSIICAGVKMTVDVAIGDFTIINLNATIGHDVVIGDFCSLMPSVNISGNVTLGKQVFIGTGASVLQGITIGDNAIIGAGALVTNNVAAGQTVIGIPAKSK